MAEAKTSDQKCAWLFMEQQEGWCGLSEGANGRVSGRRGGQRQQVLGEAQMPQDLQGFGV